jgi:general secretion pathway protein D
MTFANGVKKNEGNAFMKTEAHTSATLTASPQRLAPTSPFNSDRELRWIQITASVVSVIGLMALFALMIQNAQAAGPSDQGFAPGNRPPFPSPFGNQGAGSPPPFFEDDEETDYYNQGEMPATPPNNPPSRPSGGPGASRSAPSSGSVSFGGNAPGNGIISKKNVASIQLDAETGEGGRELVSDFNFPDADIMDIAKTLGRLTGKNFIFDKDVKGRISIISNSPITVGDAWKAFLTALDMNGFALIPSGKYIRIARQRDARDKQLKTYTGDYSPDTDALITRVFPLKYIDAEEVARTFRSFMPANSRIIPYEQTNTVIVTDTGSNIAKLNKMLDILDVEGYDAGIEVIPVKYASAAELSKLIDTLIPGTGGSPVGGAPVPRFGGGGRTFSARRTKEGGIINTIIADERTNTLIVHANSKGAGQVRALVNKLDQKQPAQVGGGKVHVYYLQFADAEQIANTLNSLSQTSGRPASPILGGGGGTGINPASQNIFEGAVKVSADKSTNSLVVNASPADYGTVRRVIERLDIPRDQVYVEVVVMEIAMTKKFEFSANVASPVSGLFSTPNGDLLQSVTAPGTLTGAVLGFKSGGSQSVQINGQTFTVSNVQGLIRAIQTESKSNVLATPQIIALDNTEATFDQTEKIPVPSSTAVQGAGVSTSFTKESVPLSIKIKPQINKMSNFVKLDVEAKISSIQNESVPSALQSQTFGSLERSAKSSVFIGDSDTMVLGGLIRDQTSTAVNKIPLLGDIPILGWLFSSRTNTVQKTNLLIFLTPRIVRQYEKVRAILDRKLKERDDFIEKQFGGQDPSRAGRDELIRGLPDVKELSKKPQASVSIDEDEPVPSKPTDGAKPVDSGRPPIVPNTSGSAVESLPPPTS